jgi:DNA phosphorothioation-associated putative methyltransferase
MSLSGNSFLNAYCVHTSALESLPEALQEAARRALSLLADEVLSRIHVIKILRDGSKVVGYSCPLLTEVPFPELTAGWSVDLKSERVSFRDYSCSLNPPIVQRVDLLLSPEHPKAAETTKLLQQAKRLGLPQDISPLGFRIPWERLLNAAGVQVKGLKLAKAASPTPEPFELFPTHALGNLPPGSSIALKMLKRFGFLEGSFSLFYHGGGEDAQVLQELGVPVFGLEDGGPGKQFDVVHLSQVLSGLEELEERTEALQQAYALTERLMVVSVRLHNQNISGDPYGDGILGADEVYQKYYTPQELYELVDRAVEEEAIAVAPGVVFVFKDKALQQKFLLERSRSRMALQHLIARNRRRLQERTGQEALPEVLTALWHRSLELGREPHPEEVEDTEALKQALGSVRKALKAVAEQFPGDLAEAAETLRREDLKVFFALELFKRRRPYQELDPGLQRDIKHFFKNYTQTQQEAKDLLFQIADTDALQASCLEAAQSGLGWMDEDSLQLHSSLVERLPALLRIYVGCASHLVGDVSSMDLVKIHIRSGKLSVMRFDDFFGQRLPKMLERIKIDLRKQDVQVFDYSEPYDPPYLYHKSRFLHEEMEDYAEQQEFEEQLDGLGLFDFSGYGPSVNNFHQRLSLVRWEYAENQLRRAQAIPELDEPCGENLTFRDLVECGAGWQTHQLPNLPLHPDSYTALYDLATRLLDPVIDYFGDIVLTFGFCSPELARKLKWGALKTDQHAAHELGRTGKPVCARLGAAVDFLVEDEDMLEVAQWIVSEELPFDRMVLYGTDRPMHLSFRLQGSQEVELRSGEGAPRAVSAEELLDLSAEEAFPSE